MFFSFFTQIIWHAFKTHICAIHNSIVSFFWTELIITFLRILDFNLVLKSCKFLSFLSIIIRIAIKHAWKIAIVQHILIYYTHTYLRYTTITYECHVQNNFGIIWNYAKTFTKNAIAVILDLNESDVGVMYIFTSNNMS